MRENPTILLFLWKQLLFWLGLCWQNAEVSIRWEQLNCSEIMMTFRNFQEACKTAWEVQIPAVKPNVWYQKFILVYITNEDDVPKVYDTTT